MATENTLLEKLEAIKIRFEETAQKITDPEVIADVKLFVKLNKEYRHLEPIVDVYKRYKTLISRISSSFSVFRMARASSILEINVLYLLYTSTIGSR